MAFDESSLPYTAITNKDQLKLWDVLSLQQHLDKQLLAKVLIKSDLKIPEKSSNSSTYTPQGTNFVQPGLVRTRFQHHRHVSQLYQAYDA